MITIGKRNSICFEIGDVVDEADELRYIDIWVANQLVTSCDNIAYIPAVFSAAVWDLSNKRNLCRFSKNFEKLNVCGIHKLIRSVRLGAADGTLDNSEVYKEHQVLNWGPNTDHVLCFLIENNSETYLTLQFTRSIGGNSDLDVIHAAKIDQDYFNSLLNEFVETLSRLRSRTI